MPSQTTSTKPTLTRAELRRLIEQHGDDVLVSLLAALRDDSGGGTAAELSPTPPTRSSRGRREPWRKTGLIEGFSARWPAKTENSGPITEHYGPMTVYETRDGDGPVRLAIGAHEGKEPVYGRDRGWVSVWHVLNGRPVRQLANFLETDDFELTRERAALISGKDGKPKGNFSPGEEGLLPDVYRGMRIEVQRDRLVGPNARNRLIVVARDEDTDVMLDHALTQLYLRS